MVSVPFFQLLVRANVLDIRMCVHRCLRVSPSREGQPLGHPFGTSVPPQLPLAGGLVWGGGKEPALGF